MKYSIMSADSKSHYKDFWPTVSQFWREVVGITPILFLVSDETKDIREDKFGLIKEQKCVTSNMAFESQIIRLYGPHLFPNDVCITSDIDMYPLSNMYFNTHIDQILDDEFMVLSDGIYPPSEKKYPMCYNIAKGKTFSKVFGLNDNYEDFVNTVLNEYGDGWSTDERLLYDKLQSYHNLKILNRSRKSDGRATKRIDRIKWDYDILSLSKQLYIDCHFFRPFNDYKDVFNPLYKTMISEEIHNYNYNFIHNNKINNKPWYFGLEGDWWHGMNEEQFLDKISNDKFRI